MSSGRALLLALFLIHPCPSTGGGGTAGAKGTPPPLQSPPLMSGAPPPMGAGGLHHTMAALKLQQFKYNLKKKFLRRLFFSAFCQSDGPSHWGGEGITKGGGDTKHRKLTGNFVGGEDTLMSALGRHAGGPPFDRRFCTGARRSTRCAWRSLMQPEKNTKKCRTPSHTNFKTRPLPRKAIGQAQTSVGHGRNHASAIPTREGSGKRSGGQHSGRAVSMCSCGSVSVQICALTTSQYMWDREGGGGSTTLPSGRRRRRESLASDEEWLVLGQVSDF